MGTAQEVPDIVIEEDRPTFGLRTLQINYNLLRLGENLLNKPKNSQEIQVEWGIHDRYALVADLGTATTRRGDSYAYESKGSYWRSGIDVNMSKDVNSGNMIGIGLRYAQANFEDQIRITRSFQDKNDQVITQMFAYNNPQLSSEWMEFVFKMRVSIWKQLYMGYTLRYQFFNQLKGDDKNLQTFDIPGYGKTSKPNSFGFDYYVGWRINFK